MPENKESLWKRLLSKDLRDTVCFHAKEYVSNQTHMLTIFFWFILHIKIELKIQMF